MQSTQNIKVILTEDGSHSLQLTDLDETYHSTHGAIQESNHVFIEAGFNHCLAKNIEPQEINILEFGFGTGLNVLLTALAETKDVSIKYDSIEKHPISKEISSQLNYGEILNNDTLFKLIHSSAWGGKIQLTPSFYLSKFQLDFRDFTSNSKYHLIYFDAFAPSKQPKLWTKEVLSQCYDFLLPGGIFVTYSAKGQLKRDLISLGFEVESLPGPPGKFEITRAVKP